jgi:acyl-ACP thioesterase
MPDHEMLPPNGGRAFTVRRRVRLGDTWPDGSLRLDALARYLQDIASDDMADAGMGDTIWVVRRALVALDGRPSLNDDLDLTTFCSGLGSRWAERRTTITSPGARLESCALWIHVDPDTGVPTRYPAAVTDLWGGPVAGRKVSGRLTLPDPGPGLDATPWPIRPADIDVLAHVNNAVHWSALDDPAITTGRVRLEYRTPIDPDASVELLRSDDGHDRWLVSDAGVHAAGRITPADPPPR